MLFTQHGEQLTQLFVDKMYKNMWQYMNPDTIAHILQSAKCSSIGFSHKDNVYNEDFSDDKYTNTICFMGTPEQGHYVFVDKNKKVWCTYEMKLIDTDDDGICHGGALAAALNSCGYSIGTLHPTPTTMSQLKENYNTILSLYIVIIEKGWWDKALKNNFYDEVYWIKIDSKNTTVETQAALEELQKYIIRFK